MYLGSSWNMKNILNLLQELIKQDASELKYYHLLNDESLLNLKGGTVSRSPHFYAVNNRFLVGTHSNSLFQSKLVHNQ